MTNLRAKVVSALQPRRLVSFVIAVVMITYYALRGPDERIRHWCMALAIFLPLARLLVLALSSIVTKSSLEYLTMMTLSFDDDGIEVMRWGIAKAEDWAYVRSAYRQQGTLSVLQMQNSYDFGARRSR